MSTCCNRAPGSTSDRFKLSPEPELNGTYRTTDHPRRALPALFLYPTRGAHPSALHSCRYYLMDYPRTGRLGRPGLRGLYCRAHFNLINGNHMT